VTATEHTLVRASWPYVTYLRGEAPPPRTEEERALRQGRACPVHPVERIARGLQRATEPDVWFEDSEHWRYRAEARAIVAANAARRQAHAQHVTEETPLP